MLSGRRDRSLSQPLYIVSGDSRNLMDNITIHTEFFHLSRIFSLPLRHSFSLPLSLCRNLCIVNKADIIAVGFLAGLHTLSQCRAAVCALQSFSVILKSGKNVNVYNEICTTEEVIGYEEMDQGLVDEVSILLNSLPRFIHEDFDGEVKVIKLLIFRISQIALGHSSRFGSFFIRQMCIEQQILAQNDPSHILWII